MLFKSGKKNKSIFLHFLQPMSIFVILQTIILIGCLILSQLIPHLNKNAKDIVDQRVVNRSEYLRNEMLNNWSNLNELTDYINTTADNLNHQGIIDFNTLDDSSANATPLLLNITEKLISTMRLQRVTGAYIILNTADLSKGIEDKPGIYLRDLDPLSKASVANADLLFERAPVELVKKFNISTDSSWQPRFEFNKKLLDNYDYFYAPFQEALNNSKDFSVSDLGYWGHGYSLNDNSKGVITYSLPLINSSGLVYGVVGVDITLDYLNKLLPSNELFDGGMGSYLLAIDYDEKMVLDNVFVNGNTYAYTEKKTFLQGNTGDYYIKYKNKKLYGATNYLEIYNSNTPYSNQRWVLVGLVSADNLFAFTNKIIFTFVIIILLIFLMGISGSLLGSYFISKPIKRLSKEVEMTRDKDVNFIKTNISEIDHLANTMKQLNKNIQDASVKFSMILKMASVKLAGFEYNAETKELFLSDNFFEILLNNKINTYQLTPKCFIRELLKYRKYITSKTQDPIEYLLKIPKQDNYIFVKLKLVVNGTVYMGVIEDITSSILEKKILEYERDHDALTGLLNRRAFVRLTSTLFNNAEAEVKTAALIMLDLDDLKYINDTYGHETGDRYISAAADIFKKTLPEDAIIARISGDEFFILLYGYNDESAIEPYLVQLKQAILKAYITIAGGKNYHIKASGGVAWYPRDTDSFEILQQYADYAMYKVKHSSKGSLTNFNCDEYVLDSYYNQAKKELNMLINDNAFQFYLQPIVDSHDGTIFAYEALMRSFMPLLKSPLDILKVAKQEGRLGEIETLTWFNALSTFQQHIENKLIDPKTKIFINSLSNQTLSKEAITLLESKYKPYLKNIVLEVSEVEIVDQDYQVQKEMYIKKWGGALALDDYGSGYNGEKTLLAISPKYIKIDMEIIRDIDTNPDKAKMVENIVNYAHERKMKIIAEGVETIMELKRLIELKVDYLQGFLLAKPQFMPPTLQPDIIELLHKLNKD